tara:strand:- start:12876 stop:13598 length:723 start_codon:yes stop_codon:yes gene_type:complete
MSEKQIVKLSQSPAGFDEIADDLKVSLFESPTPKQHTHSYYEDEALGLYIGVWDTTDMIETTAPYVCDEFMTIIEGTVGIKNNQTGEIEKVTAGESFVIPQGYDCQWHQHGYLRKFYVIYEPPTDAIPESPVCEHIIYIDEKSNIPWQETSDGFNKKVQYQSHNQKFTSGVWQGKNLKTGMIAFPYNEFISLKQGCLICTDVQGIAHKINAGEALFVPQGTRCSWQSQEKISLHFVQIKQ